MYKLNLVFMIVIILSLNSYSQDKMVKFRIDKEAKEYISKNKIDVLTIYVGAIPCGCVRPREVTRVDTTIPEIIKEYDMYQLNQQKVYLKKGLKIPEDLIGIKLGQIGNEKKLYPTGIEYFNGMGPYCEIPQNNETD